jgi:hypothetical protein
MVRLHNGEENIGEKIILVRRYLKKLNKEVIKF